MSRRLALVAPVIAACALAFASPALAIEVDNSADTADTTTGDHVCQSPCTLRAAVQTANETAGPDTIHLPTGMYTRSIGGADVTPDAAVGDLDVTDDLTITGDGQATTIVDGNDMERVFDITPNVTATISGVTIRNGTASDGAFSTAGGGVRVGAEQKTSAPAYLPPPGPATLTLNDVTLSANAADDGSGIATDHDGSMLTMNRVSILDNIAPGGGSEGGGVNSRFGGTTTINSSLIKGNKAASGGGVTEDFGTVNINDSTVTENETLPNGQGGGVSETGGGTVTVTRSVVSKNASEEGGGVVMDGGGTLNVVDSTISENKTMGGTFLDGGGVLKDTNGDVNISGSTIVGNTSGSQGGGIEDIGGGGAINVTNSTITGNHAADRGGGIHTFGAGTINLTNVTMRDNLSDTGAEEIDNCNDIPMCGSTPHTINVTNTIVASGGVNCTGPITSGGHNIDSGSTCGFAAGGDKPGTDPLLGALANNGGSTQTFAELDGSPAIDAGEPANCPATDQRGVGRPVGPTCDIGAFERSVAATIPPDNPPVTPPVNPPVTPPVKPPKCKDKLPPITTLKRGGVEVGRRSFKLHGRSHDRKKCRSGVGKVQVSLARVRGRTGVNCRFVRSDERYQLTGRKNCRQPTLFRATGTSKWSFSFDLRLRPGLYRVQARATDKKGNKETPKKRRNIVFFSVK
jgi:hypothetical protein